MRVDRDRAAIEGLDPDSVARQLEVLVGGRVVGQVQAGEKLIDIRLWSPPSLRGRIDALQSLRLRAPDGHDLPVKRVAEIRIAPGQPQIQREDLEQMIAVTARLEAGPTWVPQSRTFAAKSAP